MNVIVDNIIMESEKNARNCASLLVHGYSRVFHNQLLISLKINILLNIYVCSDLQYNMPYMRCLYDMDEIITSVVSSKAVAVHAKIPSCVVQSVSVQLQ